MKRKITSRIETQIIKIVKSSNLVFAFINVVMIYSGIFISKYFQDNIYYEAAFAVGGAALALLINRIGDDTITGLIMKSIKIYSVPENELCGNWLITIEYEEGGLKKSRDGVIIIEKTIAGLVIYGDRIYSTSKQNKTVVVENWLSDYVELTDLGSQRILSYSFKIQRKDDKPNEFSKTGNVVLRSNDEMKFSVFKGDFVDLFIPEGGGNDGERLRRGTVTLRRG